MQTSLLFTYLTDYPHLIGTIAAWLHQEWRSFYPSETEAQIAVELETHLNRDRLPLTIVALEESPQPKLIGTVTLMHGKTEAPPEYADWSPWLASLYVIPEKRGEGIGRLLVQRALEEADRLKLSLVYLWTEQTELMNWYQRQGWQTIAQTKFQQQPVQIMRYDRKVFQDIGLPGIAHRK